MVFDEFKETNDQVIAKDILLLIRLPFLQTPRHCEFLEKCMMDTVRSNKGKAIFHPYLDGEYSYPSVMDDIHFSNFSL